MQEVSGGMWLQILRVDGIKNGLWGKSSFSCFFPHSVDGVGHPWQGPFFLSKSTSPFNKTRILLFWGVLVLTFVAFWCAFQFNTQILNFSKINTPKQQYTCFFERGRVVFEKKRPLPGMPDTVVRVCFHQKSQNQGILTKIIHFSEKVREAK